MGQSTRCHDKTQKGQHRDREEVWIGMGGRNPGPNTSFPFPLEPSGTSSSSIPVYCALLATVVLGLLAYVAFKQQLAKAWTAELGALHRGSSVSLDSPTSLEPCAPNQGELLAPIYSPADLALPYHPASDLRMLPSPTLGPHPELGCRLYLHRPRQQEEVELLLEVSGKPDKGWQGLAGHVGYQADAVAATARGQVPAYTLLRDWAVQEGSGATLRVREVALAAMGRKDVIQVPAFPAEGHCAE
ncbi:hypothetical protein MC885_013367 [Smutsia gigantea]|nr:hypothetical protein MC885_013367 [Smutsia gigantea]